MGRGVSDRVLGRGRVPLGTRQAVAAVLAVAAGLTVNVSCAGGSPAAARGPLRSPPIVAVGAENEYANVISQVGGRYVHVTAVMSNPNTDPHSFEASAAVAQQVASAQLVVQNGAGYDSFMNAIEQAASNSGRKVVVAQRVLGLPASLKNPHLWYAPRTMPAVAAAVERDLAALAPGHAAYFRGRLSTFDASLSDWTAAIANVRQHDRGAPVATTEPVADDLLQAAGITNKTPFSFQADVMNGVDPSPQAVALVQDLLQHRRVHAFVYNEQVTDSLTQSLLSMARSEHIPVVGVYETMPKGYDYQRWMEAEVQALGNALAHGTSAPQL